MSVVSDRCRGLCLFLSIVLLALAASHAPGAHAQPEPERSVVYVAATTRHPNYTEPWRRSSPDTGGGTGFVIQTQRDGKPTRLILTANHVVQFADHLFVELPDGLGRQEARLVIASPAFDLALLELTDSDALEQIEPLPLSPVPPLVQDEVRVFGYPIGGADLSVTSGIISRIETTFTDYDAIALSIQIDAALNPGNSGGPAISNDRCVGLAYLVRDDAENIGYLVPSVDILHFLKDAQDGTYDGPQELHVEWQTIENQAQRQALKLPGNVTGVWVKNVRQLPDNHPMTTQLQRDDVITKIGSAPIDDDGQTMIFPDVYGNFEYLADRFAYEGKVSLSVYRDGQLTLIQEPVTNQSPHVIPWLKNQLPSYYIVGPLVFTQATRELYHEVNDGYKPVLGLYGSPLMTRYYDFKRAPEEQLVAVASSYFPHPTTQGLEDPMFNVVDTLNGQRIKNLKHFVTTLEKLQDPYVDIVFQDRLSERVIFNRKTLFNSTEPILEDNGIRRRASPDLRPLLND